MTSDPRKRQRNSDLLSINDKKVRMDTKSESLPMYLKLNHKCIMGIADSFKKEFKAKYENSLITIRTFSEANSPWNTSMRREAEDGWIRFRRVNSNLEKCIKQRSPMQIQFQQYCIIACLQFIFAGNALSSEQSKILAMFRLEELFQLVAARTPRQSGKSESVAAFAASMLEACPGMIIIIYSNSQRASDSLKSKIERNLIQKLGVAKERIVRNSSEEIKVAPVGTGIVGKSQHSSEAKAISNLETTSVCRVMPGGGNAVNSK